MEIIKTFEPGELIFKQGDLGDSMLMIKEGSVEVFKDTPLGEVLLTVQGSGEVIGMLTFFNAGQRLASARARTHVEGQLISRTVGQDPLQNLPRWVQVVLKEFTTRLEQINDQFARALQEKNDLLHRGLDQLTISTQIADSLAELGPSRAKRLADGREVLFLGDIMLTIGNCLSYEASVLSHVVEIFKNTGLMKVELEPDHNKEVISLAAALRLKWYADFVRSSRSGKFKKMVQTAIPFKQRKVLFALREYVAKTGADPNKAYSTDLTILAEQFENLMKVPLDQGAIDLAEKINLIELKKQGDKVSLSFHPTNLVRTLIAINVIRRLRSEPGTEETDPT